MPIDVGAAELLHFAREDPETEIIGAYIEGLEDARGLFRQLRRTAAAKPVALLKGGLLPAGGRAAQSHTASLAGSGRLWRAAARQANAILVENMAEMIDVLVGWRFGAAPPGPRLALVVGGGGVSVQGADDVEREGLQLPPLADSTLAELARFTPLAGTGIRNPVDTTSMWNSESLEPTLDAVARDARIDAVVIQLGMNWGPPDDGDGQRAAMRRSMIRTIADLRDRLAIPISVVVPLPRDHTAAALNGELVQIAAQAHLPVFHTIRGAARTLRRLLDWQTARNRRAE